MGYVIVALVFFMVGAVADHYLNRAKVAAVVAEIEAAATRVGKALPAEWAALRARLKL